MSWSTVSKIDATVTGHFKEILNEDDAEKRYHLALRYIASDYANYGHAVKSSLFCTMAMCALYPEDYRTAQ